MHEELCRKKKVRESQKVLKHSKDSKERRAYHGKFKVRGGLVDALLSVKTVVCLSEFVVEC